MHLQVLWFGSKEVKKIQKYLEFDRFLEDRGATGGLVLCPKTVLRHHTVAEGRDLERENKNVILSVKKHKLSSVLLFILAH